MNLYNYDIETLIIRHNSPYSLPKELKHLILYNTYDSSKSSFRIDTVCKIPDTLGACDLDLKSLEDILFIGHKKYLSIKKGKYSKISIQGTPCKSITIGNKIINADTLSIGLFKDEMLNKVKDLNKKWE
jgi:hypothetical protein